MNIVFWNMHRQQSSRYLIDLVVENNVDIVILAENILNPADFLSKINQSERQRNFSYVSLGTCLALTIFIRLPRQFFRVIAEKKRVAILDIHPPTATSFLLIAGHFPSKLYTHDIDQLDESKEWSSFIRENEDKVGHRRTLFLGDLNMNPFEAGLVSASGFNAVMTRDIAMRESRTVRDVRYPFFYNPMWSLLGDQSQGPAGTYYYSGGRQVKFYWNSFDQALIRPAMLDIYPSLSLRVVEKIREQQLLTNKGIPDKSISDHLPLLCQLT